MTTWDEVRAKLQEAIGSEDKTKPLTDEDIKTELGKKGIVVARRTVTRTRQQLNIRSWRGRRVRAKIDE
jgi:RNA polymerase sigma-54 factor